MEFIYRNAEWRCVVDSGVQGTSAGGRGTKGLAPANLIDLGNEVHAAELYHRARECFPLAAIDDGSPESSSGWGNARTGWARRSRLM